MNNNGFTLVEVMMALFLLGLLTITIFPIFQTSLGIIDRNNLKLEMMHIGEMTIEKLKAFKEDSEEELYIYNTKVKDVIDIFSDSSEASLSISTIEDKDYKIQISKEEKNEGLWIVSVLVSYEKGEKHEEIEYKAFLQKK